MIWKLFMETGKSNWWRQEVTIPMDSHSCNIFLCLRMSQNLLKNIRIGIRNKLYLFTCYYFRIIFFLCVQIIYGKKNHCLTVSVHFGSNIRWSSSVIIKPYLVWESIFFSKWNYYHNHDFDRCKSFCLQRSSKIKADKIRLLFYNGVDTIKTMWPRRLLWKILPAVQPIQLKGTSFGE
jgi:hypothetical protein